MRIAVADDLEDLLPIQAWSIWARGGFQVMGEAAGRDKAIAAEGASECCTAMQTTISVLKMLSALRATI